MADGQFVYGPNVGTFDLADYLAANAPLLSTHADELYERSRYFSINPKVYLTLLEMRTRAVSRRDAVVPEDPWVLGLGSFIAGIDYVSERMTDAYYSHLSQSSPLAASQRQLTPIVARGGAAIAVAPETNAGTYAVIAGLAAVGQPDVPSALDDTNADGFYQTYSRLFANDDPRDERNPGLSPRGGAALAAPNNLLQVPYLQGLSWKFGGVHNNGGGTTFTDASAMDFFPSGSAWGIDTSNMWVVASAAGVPTKISACYFLVAHGGGWETTYYHLENIQNYSGSIKQNDKIGNIANTLAEATCSGGAASGPHVHFTLRYNGVLVAINGTALSGWYVHAGRWSYDTDPAYMWLDRAGARKYPNQDFVLSEGAPTVAAAGVTPWWGPVLGGTVVTITGTNLVAGQTSVTIGDAAATSVQVTSATSLTANVPAHAAGSVDVVVATPAGTATLQNGFSYVVPLAPFTDDPLTPRGTPPRAAHVVELRQAIDSLRARARLESFAWTDPTIVAGVTRIKATHLTEIRTALSQVYMAVGRAVPVYSDPVIVPGSSTMAASHIAELRVAVIAIW